MSSLTTEPSRRPLQSLEGLPVYELQHIGKRRVEWGSAEKYYRRWNLRLGRYAGGRTGEAFGGD